MRSALDVWLLYGAVSHTLTSSSCHRSPQQFLSRSTLLPGIGVQLPIVRLKPLTKAVQWSLSLNTHTPKHTPQVLIDTVRFSFLQLKYNFRHHIFLVFFSLLLRSNYIIRITAFFPCVSVCHCISVCMQAPMAAEVSEYVQA